MDKIKYIDRRTGDLITESPPGESLLKLLYYNPLGKLSLHLLVKRKIISSIYGRMMNAPGSVSRIEQFVQELGIDMSEAVKSIDEFSCFNDFFYRKLKPDARPIEEGLVSPADGKLLAFKKVEDVQKFFIKGQSFTLDRFLGNQDLADKYRNASLLIFRLAPNDYHRFHFPYSGIASGVTQIKGSYYSVSPYAIKHNFAQVFCENKREYMTLKTVDKNDILLVPVGATMVGTIIETYSPDTQIVKGDEMGYFAFGGSTVVMLVDQRSVVIDNDIINNTKNKLETAVKMGERIGN